MLSPNTSDMLAIVHEAAIARSWPCCCCSVLQDLSLNLPVSDSFFVAILVVCFCDCSACVVRYVWRVGMVMCFVFVHVSSEFVCCSLCLLCLSMFLGIWCMYAVCGCCVFLFLVE